jgi:hypothetical protein
MAAGKQTGRHIQLRNSCSMGPGLSQLLGSHLVVDWPLVVVVGCCFTIDNLQLLLQAVHDYDHGGRTNDFLVNTNDPLAVLYNDR